MPYVPSQFPIDPSPSSHLTAPGSPPPTAKGRPRTIWPERFEEACKQPEQWFQVFQPLTKGTAAQIASDIRCAHRRDVHKMRMRGVRQGERWEAVHGPWAGDSNPTHFYVWIRFVGSES